MNAQNDDDARIVDLLTDRLEGPLSKKEREELDALLTAHPEWRRYDLEFAAAAAHLALEPSLEEMPEALKARLIGAVVGEASRPPLRLAPTISQSGSVSKPQQAPAATTTSRGGGRTTRLLVMTAPWMAAAAAIVVAIVSVTQPGVFRGGGGGGVDRDALVKEPGAVALSWATTADPLGKNVKGDVVWSASKQAGVMRFRDLPANDPTKAQYQLWIFDAERDERYPVDGGVFDVNENGETVVAIHAKVPVGKVTLFAVTLERPGGVVVSTRERLVALAKVG